MKSSITHYACFLLLLASAALASSESDAELSPLSIKLEVKGKPLEYSVVGKKLDRELIPIRPLSEDFNIGDMDNMRIELRKELQDPIEAFICFMRLQRDDLDKADGLFLADDDREVDPKTLAILRKPEMRARIREHLKQAFSVQPLLLVKTGENLVELYIRIVGTTPDGDDAYRVISNNALKKIGAEWKVLPRTLSEDDPKTAMSFYIVDALREDEIAIEPVTTGAR